MGKNEHSIEDYLADKINDIGGVTRKWICPGRVGVPDQIVILQGVVWFVEVKDLNKTLSPAQEREKRRLIKAGAKVISVEGHTGVDEFLFEVIDYIVQMRESGNL